VGVVRPWHRLPRETVAAPSLAVFRTGLDGALSTLGLVEGGPAHSRGWNEMVYKVPSNPNHSMMIL